MQIYVHKTNYAIKIKIMNNINKKQKKKKWLWKPDLYLTSINLQNEKKKDYKIELQPVRHREIYANIYRFLKCRQSRFVGNSCY